MKPAGFLLLLFLVILFLRRKPLLNLYTHIFGLVVALEIYVNVGYFLIVGSYELIYSEFLLAILAVLSCIIVLKFRIETRLDTRALILIIAIILSTLMLIVFPFRDSSRLIVMGVGISGDAIPRTISFSINTVMRIVRILLFMLYASSAIRASENQTKFTSVIAKYVYGFGWITLIFLCFEWVSKNIFSSLISHKIINTIFGVGGSTLKYLIDRGGLFSLQGFTREPSHLAVSLFLGALVIILSKTEFKHQKLFVFMMAAFSFASLSFSGLLTGILLVYVMIIYKYIRIPTPLLIGFFVIILLYNVLYGIDNALMNYYDTSNFFLFYL